MAEMHVKTRSQYCGGNFDITMAMCSIPGDPVDVQSGSMSRSMSRLYVSFLHYYLVCFFIASCLAVTWTGHCICFIWHMWTGYSRILSGAELNYDTHDKELLAVFEAFKTW
jgi:hypothetical protein